MMDGGCARLLCSVLGGKVRVYHGERRHDFLVRRWHGSICCEWSDHGVALYASGSIVCNSQLPDRHVQALELIGHLLGLSLGREKRDRHNSPHPLSAWLEPRCRKLVVQLGNPGKFNTTRAKRALQETAPATPSGHEIHAEETALGPHNAPNFS